MNRVYLSLGSNRGDRDNNLETAIKLLQEKAGEIAQASSVYETAPWQMTDDTLFLNQVIAIDTRLSAFDLLDTLLRIEQHMGRVRYEQAGYEPRIIDIDILFFNNDVLQSKSLVIPHPQLTERRFVLEPLAEIAANYVHPQTKKPVSALLADCNDRLSVKRLVYK